jgi:hypothetical protein
MKFTTLEMLSKYLQDNWDIQKIIEEKSRFLLYWLNTNKFQILKCSIWKGKTFKYLNNVSVHFYSAQILSPLKA